MSIWSEFTYHLPEGGDPRLRERAVAEAPEVETQYLNWLVELSPEELRAVEGSAPFLEEFYRENERAYREWQEEHGIDLAVDDPPEDADVLDAQWQEFTAPVPAMAGDLVGGCVSRGRRGGDGGMVGRFRGGAVPGRAAG
jgi:hypothetical protein